MYPTQSMGSGNKSDSTYLIKNAPSDRVEAATPSDAPESSPPDGRWRTSSPPPGDSLEAKWWPDRELGEAFRRWTGNPPSTRRRRQSHEHEVPRRASERRLAERRGDRSAKPFASGAARFRRARPQRGHPAGDVRPKRRSARTRCSSRNGGRRPSNPSRPFPRPALVQSLGTARAAPARPERIGAVQDVRGVRRYGSRPTSPSC